MSRGQYSHKKFMYAAYETKSGKELCIAVGDTLRELASQLNVSPEALSNQMRRLRNGQENAYGYYVMKIFIN